MGQTISSTLGDPLIVKAIWSVVVLFICGMLVVFIRLLINSRKMDSQKARLVGMWSMRGAAVLALIILFWMWVSAYLRLLFDQVLVEKILISFFTIIFFIASIIVVRRVVGSKRIALEKRHQYAKWAVFFLVLLCCVILIRIWASSQVFRFFKNPFVNKLITSAIAFGFVYGALFFTRRFINSLKIEIKKKHQYRKRASYGAALLYFIILVPIWAGSTKQWATFLSVMGAGIALALHEVILNIAGWIYIVLRNPYKSGDRIEIDDVKGDVIDIQLFQTTLLEIGNWVEGDQSTGRVVQVPNGAVFRRPLFNYTKGFEFLWNEISFTITFESNWEKAIKILIKCGEEHSSQVQEKVRHRIDRMSRDYLIFYKKYTPIVYTNIENNGVKITLRYLTEAKDRRDSENDITRKVLKKINREEDINFAYPTYTIIRSEKDTQKDDRLK